MVQCIYLPNPSAQAGYDTKPVFKQSLFGLNSEFSFSPVSCHTKVKELSQSYYLSIAGGRIIEFIPFSWALALCKIQTAWARIRNRLAMSISNDDNHYTTMYVLLPYPNWIVLSWSCHLQSLRNTQWESNSLTLCLSEVPKSFTKFIVVWHKARNMKPQCESNSLTIACELRSLTMKHHLTCPGLAI